MLFCNNYNGGYHLFYLKPEFTQVPMAFGIVRHVLLQHLDFYSNHATFFRLKSRGGVGYMRISSQPLFVHYIYIYECIFFWLINFYLWLVLIFLFSRVYYGFTPLRHQTSWHYTSRQLSCPYACPHTWLLVTRILFMPFKVNVRS